MKRLVSELPPSHAILLRTLLHLPDCEAPSSMVFSLLLPHEEFERTLEKLYNKRVMLLHMSRGTEERTMDFFAHLAVYEHVRPLVRERLIRGVAPAGKDTPRLQRLLRHLASGRRIISPHLEKVRYALTPKGRRLALELSEK